ncbi:MAG TPA: DNA/RNA helicase domain-containing protein [Myxococcota bacterium]|nr:DNA/RNA helicase domain-containing protein [Myxococcota bacterium]
MVSDSSTRWPELASAPASAFSRTSKPSSNPATNGIFSTSSGSRSTRSSTGETRALARPVSHRARGWPRALGTPHPRGPNGGRAACAPRRGFCWRWSDPTESGDLIPDVAIGNWRRPWNRKAGNRPYKPAEHPYTGWAETDEGESQIGVVYSAQGFEFDRIGVIWGRDLVWRNGQWIAQAKESQDRPVKSSPDMLRLVRNAYRVLLTRGLRGARLLVLDWETRRSVETALTGMQS